MARLFDFLLLAQSHGCEDVEGFCCFNLSDHSASIHKQLQWMQGHTQKIKMQADPFGEWLEGLFGELEPWLKQMLKTLIVGLAIFLAIMLCLPCFVQLLKACLRKLHRGNLTSAVRISAHSGATIDALRNRNRVRICVRVVTGQLSVAWGGGDVVIGMIRVSGCKRVRLLPMR